MTIEEITMPCPSLTPEVRHMIEGTTLIRERNDLTGYESLEIRNVAKYLSILGVELEQIDGYGYLHLRMVKLQEAPYYNLIINLVAGAKLRKGDWILFIAEDNTDIRFQLYFDDEVLLSPEGIARILAFPFVRVTVAGGKANWQCKFTFKDGEDGATFLRWMLYKTYDQNRALGWA